MRRWTAFLLWLTLAAVATAADAPKPTTVKEPELRTELIHRAKVDQDARRALTEWMKAAGNPDVVDVAAFETTLDPTRKGEFKRLTDTLEKTDEENTERLAKIVEQYGWPTHTLVGKDGAQSAWLLVQHADRSPKFQRKCLDLMSKLPRAEISQANVAYLTDRVLLAEGKKQVYGTQVTLTNGMCRPRPLDDEANVDRRRADVGLPPLAEYMKVIEIYYRSGIKK